MEVKKIIGNIEGFAIKHKGWLIAAGVAIVVIYAYNSYISTNNNPALALENMSNPNDPAYKS